MIVVHASAVVEVLLGTPAAAAAQRRLFDGGETLHAPHLLDIEVAHAVRRYAARGEIDGQRGRTALADLADFPLYPLSARPAVAPRLGSAKQPVGL